jgi:hypothetical protein
MNKPVTIDKGRTEKVDLIIEYFRSPQWQEVLSVVQDRDANHMHVLVDTYLDLGNSFRPLVDGFFRNLGWSTYRDIDVMADKPGRAALYAILLEDKVNFEIYCRFKSDTILAPMEAIHGERGGNLRVWTPDDIRRFQEQFQWRKLTPAEDRTVAEFFRSSTHWAKTIDYILDPDVMHVHCNVETCVHPDILREHAMRDLASRNFTIKHSIHSIFNGGGYDTGKIIFLGLSPPRTYDIAYYFNPSVLIDVNTQETRMTGGFGTGNEYYIVRVSTLNEELKKHKLFSLTKDEIDHILKVTSGFQKRSAYSWRFVPEGRRY